MNYAIKWAGAQGCGVLKCCGEIIFIIIRKSWLTGAGRGDILEILYNSIPRDSPGMNPGELALGMLEAPDRLARYYCVREFF